jgi:hypothetical protein
LGSGDAGLPVVDGCLEGGFEACDVGETGPVGADVVAFGVEQAAPASAKVTARARRIAGWFRRRLRVPGMAMESTQRCRDSPPSSRRA